MRFTSLLLACSMAALAGGSASAAEWRLVEVSGTVRIAVPGAEAAPARLNQPVPTGSSITTTLGARAALDNGLQHIVVGPNSRMTVAPDAGGFTRVMQDLGAVMFKVDKQKAPHFRVDTPLLAAIVKGTTFTVVVAPQSDSVNVAEGLVEVRSNATDMASDVPAGSSGAVSRDAPQAVQVTGTVTPTSGEPVAVKIEPLDYKAVSGGLVDSGMPTMMSAEAVAIAPAAASGTPAAGVEVAAVSAPPAAIAAEAARNDRASQAESLGNAVGQGDVDPRNGNGGGPKNPGPPDPKGNGNGPDGAANGNDGGPKDQGPADPKGNGNGPDGPGGGKDGGPKGPGPADPKGNGNGPDGPANGNGGGPKDPGPGDPKGNGNGPDGPGKDGGPKDPGPGDPKGNGNGPDGPGNGNGGGPKDPGPADPKSNGNGPDAPGNGNGGGPRDPGPADPKGNGNGPDGPGNGNGGGPKDPGPAGPNGNGGPGNGNGGDPPQPGHPGPNGNGGGLLNGLLTTVGGVTDGLVGAGKGRGPK